MEVGEGTPAVEFAGQERLDSTLGTVWEVGIYRRGRDGGQWVRIH